MDDQDRTIYTNHTNTADNDPSYGNGVTDPMMSPVDTSHDSVDITSNNARYSCNKLNEILYVLNRSFDMIDGNLNIIVEIPDLVSKLTISAIYYQIYQVIYPTLNKSIEGSFLFLNSFLYYRGVMGHFRRLRFGAQLQHGPQCLPVKLFSVVMFIGDAF